MKGMIWVSLTALVAVAALVFSGCACKYPQEEMDAAQAALADAKAADAPKWASDEYSSAEDELNKAERLANENECDQAAAAALESARLANVAKELAIAREAAANKPKPKPKPVVKKLILSTIYFDFDKSNIRMDQKSALNANAKELMGQPEKSVLIVGHCDERGTEEYNIALGERRAKSVKTFLVNAGVASSQLSTSSMGEEQPAAMGHNEEAWAKNRRAEFRVQ